MQELNVFSERGGGVVYGVYRVHSLINVSLQVCGDQESLHSPDARHLIEPSESLFHWSLKRVFDVLTHPQTDGLRKVV